VQLLIISVSDTSRTKTLRLPRNMAVPLSVCSGDRRWRSLISMRDCRRHDHREGNEPSMVDWGRSSPALPPFLFPRDHKQSQNPVDSEIMKLEIKYCLVGIRTIMRQVVVCRSSIGVVGIVLPSSEPEPSPSCDMSESSLSLVPPCLAVGQTDTIAKCESISQLVTDTGEKYVRHFPPSTFGQTRSKISDSLRLKTSIMMLTTLLECRTTKRGPV